MERKGVVTFKGNGVTLLGPEMKVGAAAPDFTCVNQAMEPVKLSDFKGQVVVIASVPSVDTPVCEIETKRFNQEAAKLNCKLLTISMDLPFAHKRFCAANGIQNLTTLSDFKEHSFADAFGLRIKELGLLARAVYVIDKDGKIAYQQIVPEIAQEPDYEKALAAAKQAGA